jgi:hypothetical protein
MGCTVQTRVELETKTRSDQVMRSRLSCGKSVPEQLATTSLAKLKPRAGPTQRVKYAIISLHQVMKPLNFVYVRMQSSRCR